MLKRQSSISSTNSTFVVEQCKPQDLSENDDNQRGVRFNLSLNQEHSSEIKLSQEEREAMWYTANDMALFKASFRESVERLKKAHRAASPDYWTKQLRTFHTALRNASTPREIVQIMKTAKFTIPDSACGLEKCIVGSSKHPSAKLRIVDYVMAIQENPSVEDEFERAENMRIACASISKPSVFLAYFAASNTARTVL